MHALHSIENVFTMCHLWGQKVKLHGLKGFQCVSVIEGTAMKREYLQDYEETELEWHEKFRKMVIDGKFGLTDIFPPKERFVKITEPIAFGVQPKPELWPQVPFSGSTVIMLYPVRKEFFKRRHGFEVSDINRIVDFIKETGKIQFVIDWPPTAFEGLDFLDPIFSELKPPTHPWVWELLQLPEAQRRQAAIEFDTLAHIHFYEFIKKDYAKESLQDKYFIAKRMHDYRIDYSALKALGLQDLSEQLSNLILDDPPRAVQAFIVIGAFITLPLFNTFRATLNYDLDLITRSKEYMKVQNPTFPYEIGKFLLTKLIHYPESLTACQEIMAHYQEYDLLKMVAALNDGIKRSNFDVVNATRESLSETLENIWNDTTIRKKIEGLRVGIPVSLAALGAIALGPIGAIGGFLGGLGFSVGSAFLEIKAETIGEKVAKALSQSYQVNIYDFKKKYKLK